LEGHKYGGHPYVESTVTSLENRELIITGLTDYNKNIYRQNNIAHASEFAEIPCLSMKSRRDPWLNCIPGVWNLIT